MDKDFKRLALILAIQAEIVGMKAENTGRLQEDLSIAYDERGFQEKADELRRLASDDYDKVKVDR